jgi:RNA polymerase-binding transcription factor DksA
MQYPKNLLKPVLEYFRAREKDLIKRKRQLLKEDPFSDQARLNDNASDDTEAAEQEGHARSKALSVKTEEALGHVRSAMKRVEDGSFGQCTACKKMVDTDRLKINPTAELCLECAKSGK